MATAREHKQWIETVELGVHEEPSDNLCLELRRFFSDCNTLDPTGFSFSGNESVTLKSAPQEHVYLTLRDKQTQGIIAFCTIEYDFDFKVCQRSLDPHIIPKDKSSAWLAGVLVHPHHRGKGAQRYLLRQVSNFLHHKGIEVVGAVVDTDNPHSLNNFYKQGYYVKKITPTSFLCFNFIPTSTNNGELLN